MSANVSPAIQVRGLRKSYGDKTVLDGIDLEIPAGTIFSLLGPNGAGKTTTVQILSTLIEADAGDIRVAARDVAREPDAVRATIGVTGLTATMVHLFNHAAIIHHDDSIRPCCLVEPMRHDQRRTPTGDFDGGLFEGFGSHRTRLRSGLIHNDDFRVQKQYSC